MSGREQKSTKLGSDLKRSQSAPTTGPIIEKSGGKASRSAERIIVTQGTMGMARGAEHYNANEFLNNTSSERKRTLAVSTHKTQTPTAPEMPTTSFAKQNAPGPTAETDAGWTNFGTVRNANVSPMLKSNTAATNGSDESTIPDSDLPAISDSDATGTVASEAVAVIDENTEAPRAQSTTGYSLPGSASGIGSTANISGIQNDATTEEASNEEETVEYECNICLDTAKDAVVSLCGHLFCWPCLHQWLETRPNCQLCPVCKAGIGKDKVIPLYGRDSTNQEDPRNKVFPRSAGQRPEPEHQQGFGFGFQMFFSIGAFPFSYFAPLFNLGEPSAAAAIPGIPQFEDELSKLFLYFAFLYIVWLLLFA